MLFYQWKWNNVFSIIFLPIIKQKSNSIIHCLVYSHRKTVSRPSWPLTTPLKRSDFFNLSTKTPPEDHKKIHGVTLWLSSFIPYWRPSSPLSNLWLNTGLNGWILLYAKIPWIWDLLIPMFPDFFLNVIFEFYCRVHNYNFSNIVFIVLFSVFFLNQCYRIFE